MPIEKTALGKAIKSIRIARGLTQQELASRAGMSRQGKSIALVEQGRRSVSLEALNQIGLALDVPPACLAILGSSPIAGNKAASEFQQSLQKLISALISAQSAATESARNLESDGRTAEVKRPAARRKSRRPSIAS